MTTISKSRYVLPGIACLAVLLGLGYYYFFTAFTGRDDTTYIYVDDDDTYDSICAKLDTIGSQHARHAFSTLSRHSSLIEHVHAGRYAVEPGTSTFTLFRNIKNGNQTPVSLTVPSVRTMGDMAKALSRKLMVDSAAIAQALADSAVCQKLGYDTLTIPALFIPNTYDVYWNVSVDKLLSRMLDENKKFWNDHRMGKAHELKLSPIEVTTLASIVDEETANDEEKPMVAGMYYNRLMLRNEEYPDGMPLQADPTVKFALKNFGLKRIYHDMLLTKSPYNTYVNVGLPPGPIRVPSVAGIDAVLQLKHHDYIYMCAKEDFSGTHNFASNYQEHMANAKKYAEALNKRGIK